MLEPKNHLFPRDPLSSGCLPMVSASPSRGFFGFEKGCSAPPRAAVTLHPDQLRAARLAQAPAEDFAGRREGGGLEEESPGPALHRPSRKTGGGVWPQHLPSPIPSENSFGGRSLSLAPLAPPWNRHLALGRTVAATCAPRNGAFGASASVWRGRRAGWGLEMSAERHLRSSPTSSRAGLRPPRHNKTPGAQPESASSRHPLRLGWRPPSKMS